MPAYLRLGDRVKYGQKWGTVVALTDTVGEDGHGSVEYEGLHFWFQVWREDSPEVPMVTEATGDEQFRVGLVLQEDSSPALYCLCVDDGPAPTGWGRIVAGPSNDWALAEAFA